VREIQDARVVADDPGALDELAAIDGDILGFCADLRIAATWRAFAFVVGFLFICLGVRLAVARAGWHLEDLNLLVVAFAGIHRMREAQRQGGRAFEVAIGKVGDLEWSIDRSAVVAMPRLDEKHAGGRKDGNNQQQRNNPETPTQ